MSMKIGEIKIIDTSEQFKEFNNKNAVNEPLNTILVINEDGSMTMETSLYDQA